MTNNKHMPGAMSESPHKGEPSLPNTTKPPKHSHNFGPTVQEPTTTAGLGDKYSQDVRNVEGKTRSQKKTAVEKSSKPPKGDAGSKPTDLDQSRGNPDGDRSNNDPGRRDQTRGDRSHEEDNKDPLEEENVPQTETNQEMPSNKADGSADEVESGLLDSKKPPDQGPSIDPATDDDGWETPAKPIKRPKPANTKPPKEPFNNPQHFGNKLDGFGVEENDDTAVGTTPPEVPLVPRNPIPKSPVKKKVKKTDSKPPKRAESVTTKEGPEPPKMRSPKSSLRDGPARFTKIPVAGPKDPKEREFLTPRRFETSVVNMEGPGIKEEKIREPPDWRTLYELDGLFGRRKFNGTGAWSDIGVRELEYFTRKLEDGFMMPARDIDLREALIDLKETDLSSLMPPTPEPEYEPYSELEYADDEETVPLCSVIRDDQESDYDKLRRRHWDNHDQTIERLSTINASAYNRATTSRPMDSVRINY